MSDQGFDIHSRTVAKPAPKKFKRHLTGLELIEACEKEGFPVIARGWRKEGSDFIRFGFNHGRIYVSALYSVVNGRAFGTYYTGIGVGETKFSSEDKLDGTPWFDALMAFLYRD